MHPPSRTRRILKWTGTGLSVLVLAAWLVSACTHFGTSHGDWAVFVINGLFVYYHISRLASVDPNFVNSTAQHMQGARPWGLPAMVRLWPVFILFVPLWLPLLVLAIPTAWLWNRDRPYPPGHCPRCGYDLTGNTSGVCSECGEKKAMANSEERIAK